MAEQKVLTLEAIAKKLCKEYNNNNLIIKSDVVPAYKRLASGMIRFMVGYHMAVLLCMLGLSILVKLQRHARSSPLIKEKIQIKLAFLSTLNTLWTFNSRRL